MIETIIEKANESKKLLEEIAYISGNYLFILVFS